jgi:hypothetical protein
METIPLSANGPAYEKGEERHGIPLDYVADKLGNAILELHSFALSNPDLAGGLHGAMYYQLVAFLALNNMLGAANDRSLTARLFGSTRVEVERWINLVHRQGDVSGIQPPKE